MQEVFTGQGVHSGTSPAETYQKKPVIIEALRLDPAQMWALSVDVCSWSYGAVFYTPEGYEHYLRRPDEYDPDNGHILPNAPAFLVVHTLEGHMRADAGDWIIKGVQGEFYPCKDDIFQETYVKVELDEQPEEEHGEETPEG